MVSTNTESLKFICLAGPTASGKTALSVAIAKRLETEIINGDALQIWKGLDIGTAKITEAEKEGVPHHLFDLVEPGESFTVQQYQTAAVDCIRALNKRGKTPLVVGGTGLYLQSLISDLDFGSARPQLHQRALRIEKHSAEELHRRLQALNPARADQIDPRNVRRVLRALEVEEQTTSSSAGDNWRKERTDAKIRLFCLKMDRDLLWRRIAYRAEKMLEDGLLDECRILLALPRNIQAAQGIGYREGTDYWRGLMTYDELARSIVIHTRQYAKRQMTWFRKMENVRWIETDGHWDEMTVRLLTEEMIDGF